MKMSRTVRKYRWFFAGITFSVVILMVIVGLFSLDDETNNMIVEYIEGLGWKLDPTPREISYLTIPEEFDVVYDTYNAVQKRAGFPFEEFKGKKVTRYTYRILNHKESENSNIIAGVFVFENTIIGGEISSAEVNGFMHALTETSNILTE